jgi:hypothetical protein
MVKTDRVWRLQSVDDGTMSILIYQVIAFNQKTKGLCDQLQYRPPAHCTSVPVSRFLSLQSIVEKGSREYMLRHIPI